VLDLQARISAEQAMLQNEQTKLMLLYHATEADELARRQRSTELAIQNRGSLRGLGELGLVR
jgi:type IV secretion system protein VirB5